LAEEGDSTSSGKRIGTISIKGKAYKIILQAPEFCLYYSMSFFFKNGGGPCYIVSVGSYQGKIEKEKLQAGIDTLIREAEPAILVIPEAVKLDTPDQCYALQQQMLVHCGETMKNRVALLDIYNGFKDRKDPSGDCIDRFRKNIGSAGLDYGAAYYPWLNTSLMIDKKKIREMIANPEILDQDPEGPLFQPILKVLTDYLNLMPPSPAMAGIYAMTDSSRGVWKAPANVGLSAVLSPSINIIEEEQEDLNTSPNGKSVNAIRSFPGQGTLVWGARTLDGNNRDWRYINVRRTGIMLEQSIRLALRGFVFEPNTVSTWNSILSMITNFLTDIRKQGGLAGSKPSESFKVSAGLGTTMTEKDILEGILRVSVSVALCRPGELINIPMEQKMQKA
jgi:uncharacterized protein